MKQTLLVFDPPKPKPKPRPRASARSVRLAKPLPVAEHGDVSQCWAPIDHDPPPTWEQMQADARMRARFYSREPTQTDLRPK